MSRHPTDGRVEAVHRNAEHDVSKATQSRITLIAGFGVEGDVHGGATVKHASRVAKTPEKPNLRQVHLIHSELHDDLRTRGYDVDPGQMGENVTTSGIDLLALPSGTRLILGGDAVVEVTGLRNPCKQLNGVQPGLMGAVLGRDDEGNLTRLAGVMSVVVTGGEVRPGDDITIELPPEPHEPLEPV